MNKKKIIILGILLYFFAVLVILFYLFYPKIILNGDKKVKIQYGEKYIEQGYNVKSLKGGYKVSIKSNVDENKIGEYDILYETKFLFFRVKKVRKVIVIDNVAPVLTLIGSETAQICPNGVYKEEGYTSIDNYDGDITSSVEVKTNDDSITYTSKDSSNNISTKNRNLVKADNIAPVITLNDNAIQYVYKGDNYQEKGATATDNCDGDLTSNIKISGSVDSYSVGSYEITYEVSDSSSNTAKATRYVKVINRSDYSGSTIYLTFDDGPSANITPKILDILKEENVKATFFVINASDDLNYIIKRAYDEGHTIALHSYTHNYAKIYSSDNAYFNDLYAIRQKVKNIIGVEPNIIRFPGGTSNTVSRRYNSHIMSRLSKEVMNRGFIYFDWNISSGDASSNPTRTTVYNNVVSGLSTRKTNVVLMHDSAAKTYTLEALRDIIRYGKSKGYKFDKITESTPQIKHNPQN